MAHGTRGIPGYAPRLWKILRRKKRVFEWIAWNGRQIPGCRGCNPEDPKTAHLIACMRKQEEFDRYEVETGPRSEIKEAIRIILNEKLHSFLDLLLNKMFITCIFT